MAMPRWRRLLVLLLATLSLVSRAQPEDKVQKTLAGVDAILEPVFKVTGVASNDVLSLRERPGAAGPGAAIGKIPPDATRIPLVLIPPNDSKKAEPREVQGWVVVKLNGKQGWAKRRFLAEQPNEECLPRP